MSFKTNGCQQLAFFADEVLSAIDEPRFSVLYSDKASRPTTPVNVIIGALIIKELFDYSNDELVESLMPDLYLQYALHTTSYAGQPLSDKTLSRFRKRGYDYEALHGVDLYHDCVKDLSGNIAKIIKRNPNDYNRIFYHYRNDDMESIIQTFPADSNGLLVIYKTDFEKATEYQLFVRCLSDQTVVENGKRRLRTREDETMNSSALQNPSDPDAAYRNKSGKLHRGYAANIEETFGKNGSVVTDYPFDKNTHTDSHFLQETLFTDGKIRGRNHPGYRWRL